MTIIQDLYKIFDAERARYQGQRSTKNALQREMMDNLVFLRSSLAENINPSRIIKKLETEQFIKANNLNFDFNSMKKQALTSSTFAGIKEFAKYQGWSTEKLIVKAYEKITVLKKLNDADENINRLARLQNVFKFLMLVVAHIENEKLLLKG